MDLKPCPLCANPGERWQRDTSRACCTNINCTLHTHPIFIDQWNRRPGEDAAFTRGLERAAEIGRERLKHIAVHEQGSGIMVIHVIKDEIAKER